MCCFKSSSDAIVMLLLAMSILECKPWPTSVLPMPLQKAIRTTRVQEVASFSSFIVLTMPLTLSNYLVLQGLLVSGVEPHSRFKMCACVSHSCFLFTWRKQMAKMASRPSYNSLGVLRSASLERSSVKRPEMYLTISTSAPPSVQGPSLNFSKIMTYGSELPPWQHLA